MAKGGGFFSGLGGLLGGGSGAAVGLDIGSSRVTMVDLRKARKVWKLLHFGMVQLPEDAIVNKEIVNSVAVADAIKTLANQIKLKGKSVCIGISGASLIIKRLSVQVENMKELQDQVFWEAEQYLPFDVSEVVMDFHVISKSKEKVVDVMLVAVKTSTLESYMNVVEQAGLKPKVVDVDYFAIQNAFEANYPASPAEAVAIADLGASSTKIEIIQNGVPLFTKDSSLGGKSLTAEIQRHLGVSYADAETLKIGGTGKGVPQEINELMQIAAENSANEIKRTLDLYSASASGPSPSYLLLTGGGARLPNISRMAEDIIKLPTQVLNPFNAVSYDPGVFTQDYIGAISPIASEAVGLALRMGAAP